MAPGAGPGDDTPRPFPPMMTPQQIKDLRADLGETTATFGARYGVSGRTVEDWEQGRHRPSRLAQKLMAQTQTRKRAQAR